MLEELGQFHSEGATCTSPWAFWIEMGPKFVHIRYFAVRDEAGAYLGTLEVTQDLTRLRALQGERRLLQYDHVQEGQ